MGLSPQPDHICLLAIPGKANTKCISVKILNLLEELSSSNSWGSGTGGISSSRLAWRWSKTFSQRNKRKEILYPCELVRASDFTQQGALEVCQGHLSTQGEEREPFLPPRCLSLSLAGTGECVTCLNGRPAALKPLVGWEMGKEWFSAQTLPSGFTLGHGNWNNLEPCPHAVATHTGLQNKLSSAL